MIAAILVAGSVRYGEIGKSTSIGSRHFESCTTACENTKYKKFVYKYDMSFMHLSRGID
jgi:hypothetical protein